MGGDQDKRNGVGENTFPKATAFNPPSGTLRVTAPPPGGSHALKDAVLEMGQGLPPLPAHALVRVKVKVVLPSSLVQVMFAQAPKSAPGAHFLLSRRESIPPAPRFCCAKHLSGASAAPPSGRGPENITGGSSRRLTLW